MVCVNTICKSVFRTVRFLQNWKAAWATCLSFTGINDPNHDENRNYISSHLHQLKGKALVKNAIDLGTTRQVRGVHLIPRTFNALLKIHAKLLHHPTMSHKITEMSWHLQTLHLCVCAVLLTEAGPWSCVWGRQAGSSCTPPLPSPAITSGFAACCVTLATCLGCGW